MGQKINSNIFNFLEKQKDQSGYIEKRLVDHSVFLRINIEIRNFIQGFFKTQNLTINNCKLIYLNNSVYIYVPYYQKIKENFINSKYNSWKIIQNCFSKKEIKQFSNSVVKKTINKNWELNKVLLKYKKKETIMKTNKILEIGLFFETFFIGLTNFIPSKFNISLILERQNKKLVILKQKFVRIKKKQKLLNLRKYKQNGFFKEGINLLVICLANKYSSILLAKYLAIQFQILRHHNFFFRFVKSTLILLNDKAFFPQIQGIKIQIKGRFNGNTRAKTRMIQISKVPPFLTKSSNIDHFEEISFSHNGTFGIKVWIYRI